MTLLNANNLDPSNVKFNKRVIYHNTIKGDNSVFMYRYSHYLHIVNTDTQCEYGSVYTPFMGRTVRTLKLPKQLKCLQKAR